MSIFRLFSRRSKKKTRSRQARGEPKFIHKKSQAPEIDTRKSSASAKRPLKEKLEKQPKRAWLWRVIKIIFWPSMAALSALTAYIAYDLPDMSTLAEFKKTPSIVVKAEDGTVLGTYGDVYGDFVPYNELPKHLINAVVATEDRNFFNHFGVDPIGLLRATYVNLRARHVVQGGSTITQQLAKNAFLTSERKFRRKMQEMVLALQLEHRFTKEMIITIYLNRVYMGAGNYGVDSASRRYFGHSVREATLNECAILVGLLKAPSRYAPTTNPDLSEKRATQVLVNMKEAGYLTQQEVDNAKADYSDEDANYRDSHAFGSFYFSDYIMSLLPQMVGDVKSDLVITTTLNSEWQHHAEDAVADVLAEKGKALRASQAALVSMSPDGALRAMVGGRNYRTSQFNRATQSLRQPGSSFKLFVYLAALEAGLVPTTEMEDKPIIVDNWHPRDYSGKYLGRMTIREAFAESINSIAVQLSEQVGRERVKEMAERLGITSELALDPSIALGTHEVTLLDMTKAYAHLASGGLHVMPYAITRIATADGQVLYERLPVLVPPATVLQPATVGMMNNMLLAVTTQGTGRGATIGRPVAGKTGTTSDYRDAWFIGFTPQLATGVWVGNDDTSPMKKVSGGSLPASIWHDYMMSALKNEPVIPIPNQTDNAGGVLGLFSSPTAAPVQNTPVSPFVAPEAPAANAPIPEEQPVPKYNAPPSFWDNVLGDKE